MGREFAFCFCFFGGFSQKTDGMTSRHRQNVRSDATAALPQPHNLFGAVALCRSFPFAFEACCSVLAMSGDAHFRPSHFFPEKITRETGKRPNGAAAATLAVRRTRVHSTATTKGFRASARPPPTPRTPMLARHSRQFTTQKSVFSESGDRRHWR